MCDREGWEKEINEWFKLMFEMSCDKHIINLYYISQIKMR